MGRIKQTIEIAGKNYWALYDTGARNTYVTKEVSMHLPTFEMSASNPVSLGGKSHSIKKYCNLDCKIKGYNVLTQAFVLDEIGKDDEGKTIEVLIGALVMQQWGIIPVPEKEDIDMSHYPKEFVEFLDKE